MAAEISANHSTGDERELALSCVETLGKLAGLFEERRRQLAETVGLTVQQWQVLEEVQHEHFMPSMFAQKRSSSAAAVSKILRQLTDKGLIVASVSNTDGRKRNYRVTEAGGTLLAQVRQARQLAIEQVWLKLPREELIQFSEVGAHIIERLDHFTEERRLSKENEQGETNG